jgi:hypothetical protein
MKTHQSPNYRLNIRTLNSVFNITSLNSAFTTSTGATITYYESESSANNGSAVIGPPASYSSLSATRYARLQFSSTGCFNVKAIRLTVIADPSASASGAATVCAGTNSTLLTLSVHTDTIVKWQSSLMEDFTPYLTTKASKVSYKQSNSFYSFFKN